MWVDFSDDVLGGCLKKVMCVLYRAESMKTYICRHSFIPLSPKTFFSDDLKHCLLSRSPKSALRRTDGRRVPCRFLRRRCRRFSTVCLYKNCQNDSGLIPISFRDLINDPSISTSPVVEAAWLKPTFRYLILRPCTISLIIRLALSPVVAV